MSIHLLNILNMSYWLRRNEDWRPCDAINEGFLSQKELEIARGDWGCARGCAIL